MNEEQPKFDSGLVVEQPELSPDLTDSELNQVIDERINETKKAYEKDKIDERRKTNEKYWLGQHWTDEAEKKYVDNLVYQNLEQRIKLAIGKVSDMIVTPGGDDLNSRKAAKKIERILDIDFSTKEKKRLLKNGLRHNHLYMMGMVKAVWNPNKGKFGDYEFNLCDPRKVLLSHVGKIPEDGFTSDNIDIAVEIVEEPIAQVLAKYPNKRRELMEALGGYVDGSRLASTMKYQEVWYTYHNKQGQIIEGVCWRYNHVILGRMKNPYFDFDGYDRPIFGQDGRVVTNVFGQPQTEKVFRNFFERPRKPYILFSYQNLGKTPLDDTTAVEQAIPLQRNLNKTGQQIRDISDGITNKYAFNNKIDKSEARNVTANSKQVIWIDSDDKIQDVVMSFRNDGPPPSLYNEMVATRNQIDSKFQTHATTRGDTKAAESGISKQISREGDLVTSDDLVDIVLDRVMEEMGSWAIQFMKLMYVDEHFKSKMGKDGELIQETIQRDEIDDGVAVTVLGSTVDKAQARNMALNRAEAEVIDPLTMLEDLDVVNPREQAARLMLFQLGQGEQGDAFARYMKFTGIDKTLEEIEQKESMGTNPMEQLQQMMPQGTGQMGMPPQQPPMPLQPPAI